MTTAGGSSSWAQSHDSPQVRPVAAQAVTLVDFVPMCQRMGLTGRKVKRD